MAHHQPIKGESLSVEIEQQHRRAGGARQGYTVDNASTSRLPKILRHDTLALSVIGQIMAWHGHGIVRDIEKCKPGQTAITR